MPEPYYNLCKLEVAEQHTIRLECHSQSEALFRFLAAADLLNHPLLTAALQLARTGLPLAEGPMAVKVATDCGDGKVWAVAGAGAEVWRCISKLLMLSQHSVHDGGVCCGYVTPHVI